MTVHLPATPALLRRLADDVQRRWDDTDAGGDLRVCSVRGVEWPGGQPVTVWLVADQEVLR